MSLVSFHLVGYFLLNHDYGGKGNDSKQSHLQENLQHTPKSHTQSAIPCSPIMKGIPAYSLLVKV